MAKESVTPKEYAESMVEITGVDSFNPTGISVVIRDGGVWDGMIGTISGKLGDSWNVKVCEVWDTFNDSDLRIWS